MSSTLGDSAAGTIRVYWVSGNEQLTYHFVEIPSSFAVNSDVPS